ncbi:MAG: hypothetical protein AB7I30_00395 [Isosphaeraceae bacterium]
MQQIRSQGRMDRRGWFGLLALTVAVALSASAPARADLIGNFSGNTHPRTSTQPGADAVINFAVFNKTNGVAGDTFNTGFANFDTALLNAGIDPTHPFLYLFQVVNLSTTEQVISASMAVQPGTVATRGVLTNTLSLSDNGGVMTPGNAMGPSIAVGADNSGVVLNPVGAPWVANGASTGGFTLLQAPAAIATNGMVLAAGARSAIFGYTSFFTPGGFGNAGVNAFGNGGGTSAQGLTPLAVPEPGPLALGAVGGLVFALSAWRRGRKTA